MTPPSGEIRRGLPGPGNGRTCTSKPPLSLETYAIHEPSSENIGVLSSPGSERKTSGCVAGVQPRRALPSMRRIIRSHPVPARSAWKARNPFVGCQDAANWFSPLSSSLVGSPVPSAFTQYILKVPGFARSDENTMRPPSDVQTGARSSCESNVTWVRWPWPLVHSYTQMSRCLPSEISTASLRPSGENRGLPHATFVASSTDVLPSLVIQSIGLTAVSRSPGT